MPKRKLAALEKVDADLPALQDKIRRDPLSYKEDFVGQYRQYETFKQIVTQAPASAPNNSVVSLRDQIDFISHVAGCYPALTKCFPEELLRLLNGYHDSLDPDLREKIVTSLVLLRKKDLLDSSTLLGTLFPLLVNTSSKSLRSLLYQKIVTDLRTSNTKTTNHKLNRNFQSVLYNHLVSDQASPNAIWAVRITRELWRRQIWTDVKAVEIMKEAALSNSSKVLLGALNFFLGGDKEREEAAEDSSDEDGAIDIRQVRHQTGINKKSRKNQRDMKTAITTVRKRERKRNKPHPLNFSALHLLHDPQSFAETLFVRHLQSSRSTLNLEQKLMVLQLVSRLVGLHRLTIISLYSYFLKYLTPRQASVTSFLASLAQSTHDLVPDDVLEPLVRKIANEFVSEASAGPVAAAGLNSIREICVRQPLAMNDTLLQDLVMYRKSKDKSVMMAAKGLLSLYRDVGPDMLKRRDRGRDAALDLRAGARKQLRFGEQPVGKIEGLELLETYKADQRRQKLLDNGLPTDAGSGEDKSDLNVELEDDWKAWDVKEDCSSDSGGWIDVASEGEHINVSDSDDDNPQKSEAKKQNHNGGDTIEVRSDAGLSDSAQSASKQLISSNANAETISRLATESVLTPADLEKLNELRNNRAAVALLPHARKTQRQSNSQTIMRHADDPLTAEALEGISRLGERATKEERSAARKGEKDEELEKHKGAAARRKEAKREHGKSTTNKEKARQKNFLMTLGKAKGKQKRSLREVGKVLKGHVERSKKGGRRGNR